ncbi:GDP-mannose 4,6-dehydratase [Pelagibacterales bacterium SAG-MED38]|nr:GDP-mannose 4,6-dehydratase [Pelagibacterales bacterium SAG-MED38]
MSKNKVALIFGVTGQDGSYLSEFLLKKKYIVNGVIRRSSSINTFRVDHIYQDPHEKNYRFRLHYGDITDSSSVSSIIKKTKPNEIYNLAAQSHVAVSFEVPEYTANADALGTLRILEAIKFHKLEKKTKFYQAGTSEMYGKVQKIPQNEKTNFYPQSPYGVAKLYAHWITKNYREAYKIFACNGILFNHESPRRGETFVTKKIISALCKIKEGKQKKLFLGNLNAKRDWGHARDYCLAMWKILQQKKPDDYVIATGKQYSIKQFVNITAKKIGLKIFWKGKELNEKAYNEKGIPIIECDKNYFRPLDVNTLLGDAKKARKILKWKPKENLNSLIDEMIKSEYKSINAIK